MQSSPWLEPETNFCWLCWVPLNCLQWQSSATGTQYNVQVQSTTLGAKCDCAVYPCKVPLCYLQAQSTTVHVQCTTMPLAGNKEPLYYGQVQWTTLLLEVQRMYRCTFYRYTKCYCTICKYKKVLLYCLQALFKSTYFCNYLCFQSICGGPILRCMCLVWGWVGLGLQMVNRDNSRLWASMLELVLQVKVLPLRLCQ